MEESLGGVDGPAVAVVVVVLMSLEEVGRRGFFVGLGVVGEPRDRLFLIEDEGDDDVPRSEIGGDGARRYEDEKLGSVVNWER